MFDQLSKALLFIAAVLSSVAIPVGLAHAQPELDPPATDELAAERGLFFTVPLADDPPPAEDFWAVYADASGALFYLPLPTHVEQGPVLEDGAVLYTSPDRNAVRIEAEVSEEVAGRRLELVSQVDGFERALRDEIEALRTSRRGPVAVTRAQAEAAIDRALRRLPAAFNSEALRDPLVQRMSELDGLGGSDLRRARLEMIDGVSSVMLAPMLRGRFVTHRVGTMVTPPPLDPPATRPYTTTIGLPVNEQTTWVDRPHQRDGVIDYPEAYDRWRGSQIDPENNAFTLLGPYLNFGAFGSHHASTARVVCYRKLGLPLDQARADDTHELPPIDLLQRALRRPDSYLPSVFMNPRRPPSFSYRNTGYALRQLDGWMKEIARRSEQARAAGDLALAIRWMAIGEALATHLMEDPFLGNHPYQGTGMHDLLLLAWDGRVRLEDWEASRPLLRSVDLQRQLLRHVALARADSLAVLLNLHKGNAYSAGRGDAPTDWVVGTPDSQWKQAWRLGGANQLVRDERFDLGRAMRRVNALYGELDRGIRELHGAELAEAIDGLTADHQAWSQGYILLGSRLKPKTVRLLDQLHAAHDQNHTEAYTDYVTDLLTCPTVGRLKRMTLFYQRQSAREGLDRLAAAACVYRNEHGAWPANAEILVGDYLDAIPADTHGDRPLQYTLIDGTPILWSVGEDGHDDQGAGDERVYRLDQEWINIELRRP
ncbi:MAG: hypothetical protein AAGC44_01160 [Planctomycetota bacterium]